MQVYHAAAAGVLVLAGAAPAHAEWRHEVGEVSIVANGGVSLLGALVDEPDEPGGFEADGDIDAYGSLNLEWTSNSGLILGGFGSGDTADNRPDTLKNDRLYTYVASEWGRAEVGLTSGPARRMTFYAPVVGSGQVRGDFARYAGRSALLWPVDTRQSFKFAYFSPPIGNVRFGASWSPKVERFDAVQRNAFELGAQYEQPVGDWVLGASAAYVHGDADTPGLKDINSWSLGFQARRGKLVIGGAYVDRGDSNLFIEDFGQSEVNLGVAWRATGWAVALSAARTTSELIDNDLVGLGGTYDVGRHVTLTSDVVVMREQDTLGDTRSGLVWVAGVDLKI
ncbi:MAG TPA: porin [Allosphingosinicella sp.]|jgi:predicted porin